MKKSEFLKLLSIPLLKKDVTEGSEEPEVEAKEAPALTIRGKKVRVPNVTKPKFDEKSGTLHTPAGSFRVYLPHQDKLDKDAGQKFENILNDPKSSDFHARATRNWLQLHQSLKEGKLPTNVLKHATLFSMLSPQTPVPMQELMYAHLLDSMKHTGIDAADPRFAERGGPVEKDWLSRDRPHGLPESSREYFAPGTPANRMLVVDPERPSPDAKRAPGELQPFSMPDFKFKLLANYPSMHNHLARLMSKHRHDARGMVREMMAEKKAYKLHEAKRVRGLKAGKPDIGPYAGAPIAGLAPKTARYAVAMAGGGNVHVPDTHYIRHMFGLEQRTDGDTSEYLKKVLWNPNNTHILDSIDTYYSKHHPAVAWMRNHPEFGRHFQGADAENALFPAFWKHWVSIIPHEESRGMYTGGTNEGTDHAPFWNEVMPFVQKSESPHSAVHMVKTHMNWVKKYGEIPALMMYYAYIVPQLMGEKGKSMKKSESLRLVSLPLRKTAAPVQEPEHPALATDERGMPAGHYGILTAEAPKADTVGGNEQLEAELQARGHRYEPVEGRYVDPNVPEHGFIVYGVSPEEIAELGHRYGQESVIHTQNGRNRLIYTNGGQQGLFNAGTGWGHKPSETPPENYYSTVMHNGKPKHFSLGLDFDQGPFGSDEEAQHVFEGKPKLAVVKSMKKSESLRIIHAPLRKDERTVGHKGVGVGRVQHIHPDGTMQHTGPSSARYNSGKIKVRVEDKVKNRSVRAGLTRDASGEAVSPKSKDSQGPGVRHGE